jgi:hypothetical protein
MSGGAIRVTIGALALAAGLHQAGADERQSSAGDDGFWGGTWGLDPALSSAELARGGWRYLDMSTLAWPDGRQAVVTMWVSSLGDYARCFDYFDAAMNQTGGKCERSGNGL